MTKLPTKIDDDELGPCMRALSPQRRMFVAALVFEGLDQSQAAKAAGYSASSPSVLAAHASRLVRIPEVQAALEECGRQLWKTDGPRCIRRLIQLSKQDADPKIALRATESLLDRMGMAAISQTEINVHHHTPTEAELDRRIAQLGKELGWSDDMVARAITDQSNIIEGQYEEIPAEPEPAVRSEPEQMDVETYIAEDGRDGIEDLLP